MNLPLRFLALALPVVLWTLVGCGPDGSPGPMDDPGDRDGRDPDIGPLRRVERSDEGVLVRAREALDRGRLDLARGLVDQAAPLAGTEGPLLRARLAALEDRPVDVLRLVEEARRLDPSDARVHATSAELHAAAGRLGEADREITAGIEAAGGVIPELLRARGVQLICSPGGARPGLRLLDQAREEDPALPYLGRALGQAHLLLAKEAMGSGELETALEEVELGLEFDPDDLDTRRLRAEVLMALGEWGRGITLYEELLGEGLPLEAEVALYCKNAGFWAATTGRPDLALDYYRRAAELGIPPGDLGRGAELLRGEAEGLMSQAARDLAGGEAATARPLLERALVYDPDSLLALNYLGHARYTLGQFEGAVEAWSRVIERVRREDLDLPEPLHLKLARVLALDLDRPGDARQTLEAYLDRAPQGTWAEQTRALLARLPGERAPGEGPGEGPGDGGP